MSEWNTVLIHDERWEVREEAGDFVCELGDCNKRANYYLLCLEGEGVGRRFLCEECFEAVKAEVR